MPLALAFFFFRSYGPWLCTLKAINFTILDPLRVSFPLWVFFR